MPLATRWRVVTQRLRAAERRFGRAPGSVHLLAASKAQPVQAIRQLAALGQRAFGENYLQQAGAKMDACVDLSLEWHFIGTVQSNKAAEIARRFDWVHTVASEGLAGRLALSRPARMPPLNVCLQVNIDGERSKTGVAPAAVGALARAVQALPQLRLRGLMTIPAPAGDLAAQRRPLRALRALFEALRAQGFDLDTLSMGMSDDLEAAVAEGATITRIGTALFGPRQARHAISPGQQENHAMAGEWVFIGGGNMGRALVGGLIADGTPAHRLAAAEPDAARREVLANEFGILTGARGADLVGSASVLVLAVKPQVLKSVAQDLAGHFGPDLPLIVSIAAGVTEADIAAWLGGDFPVVRCMPNTPALVRQGISALHANARVSSAQRDQAEHILRAVGAVVWVQEEALLDAVTAVSGSGPAYFFAVMEAMEQAGVGLGLAPEVARQLTLQTALGSAVLATQSGTDPTTLRMQVTSPGGTTQAALEVLQQGGFAELFVRALTAARDRAVGLAQQAAQS